MLGAAAAHLCSDCKHQRHSTQGLTQTLRGRHKQPSLPTPPLAPALMIKHPSGQGKQLPPPKYSCLNSKHQEGPTASPCVCVQDAGHSHSWHTGSRGCAGSSASSEASLSLCHKVPLQRALTGGWKNLAAAFIFVLANGK